MSERELAATQGLAVNSSIPELGMEALAFQKMLRQLSELPMTMDMS